MTSAWETEMVARLVDRFDTDEDGARTVVERVDAVCDELDDHDEIVALREDLPTRLAEQSGHTLRERWNGIVEALDLEAATDDRARLSLLEWPERTYEAESGETKTNHFLAQAAFMEQVPLEPTDDGLRFGDELYRPIGRGEDATRAVLCIGVGGGLTGLTLPTDPPGVTDADSLVVALEVAIAEAGETLSVLLPVTTVPEPSPDSTRRLDVNTLERADLVASLDDLVEKEDGDGSIHVLTLNSPE